MLKIGDEHLGKAIRCPGCGAAFRTRAAAAGPPAAPSAKVPPAPPPPRKPAPAADEEEHAPPPRRPSRKTDDDDAPSVPVKKAKRRPPRDEDDDLPRRSGKRGAAPRKKAGLGTVLGILAAVGAVLLLGCCGLGYWAWTGLSGAASGLQAKLGTEAVRAAVGAPAGKDESRAAPVVSRDPVADKPAADKAADAAPAGGAAAPAGPAAWEHTWRVWRIESGIGIDASSGDGMVIEGNTIQYLWGGNNKGATGTFTTDATKEPKEIDVQYTSGSWINQKQLGIYRLSGGQLEVSWAGVGETKRPTKFTGRLTPGAGKSYVIYRNEDFKEPEAVVRARKALEGRWMVNPRGDGVVIEDDKMQFLWGGNNRGAEARFAVDPSKDPQEIEVIYTVGSERYKRRVGICKLDGDTLTLSLSGLDGDKRPTKFAAGPFGGGDMFVVYHREKEK
jgi:uncharacterized protein (TIGR03067 family)